MLTDDIIFPSISELIADELQVKIDMIIVIQHFDPLPYANYLHDDEQYD